MFLQRRRALFKELPELRQIPRPELRVSLTVKLRARAADYQEREHARGDRAHDPVHYGLEQTSDRVGVRVGLDA